ncbi:MAG: branched-chain amino acid ABC transporter permease [bacterium]
MPSALDATTNAQLRRPNLPLITLPWLACALVGLVMLMLGRFLGSYQETLIQQVGVFIIAAVSLNIVNGLTGQFSMGHAGFMALGAYVAAATTYYGSLLHFNTAQLQPGFFNFGHVLMLIGILAGALVAAALGYLVGLPSLRLRGDYLAIVTLGFGEIVRVLLQQTSPQVNGKDPAEIAAFTDAPLRTLARIPLNGALGFEGVPAYATNLWIWTFVGITCLVAYRIKESSSGRAFLSIREDEIAARAMGINLTKYKVRAFVLAAFFAGIAGGLLAHAGVTTSPIDAGFQRSFEIIIVVVLGGLGSISGAVLAAIIFVLLPQVLHPIKDYRLVIFALLLIAMMLLRPKGLFGVREIWNILPRRAAPTKQGATP